MSRPVDSGFAMRNAGIALAIVAVAAVAGVIWWRGRAAGPADGGGTPRAIDAAGMPGAARSGDSAAAAGSTGNPADDPGGLIPPPPDARGAVLRRTRDAWRARLGAEVSFPDPLHGAAACDEIEAGLARVCAALDAGVGLDDGTESCALIHELAGRLASRRPALPEARDADAWFANAFHVFRALGSARLATARRLVEAEPELVEPLALAAYRWAITRESCRDEGQAVDGLTPARLYDYGTFAFTSFGGQAYLRRRAPRLEALGCFYALSALELSIEQGHNPHGVDPRREIERCRTLIDSRSFVWSAAYDRELDRMAQAWRRRAGGG